VVARITDSREKFEELSRAAAAAASDFSHNPSDSKILIEGVEE